MMILRFLKELLKEITHFVCDFEMKNDDEEDGDDTDTSHSLSTSLYRLQSGWRHWRKAAPPVEKIFVPNSGNGQAHNTETTSYIRFGGHKTESSAEILYCNKKKTVVLFFPKESAVDRPVVADLLRKEVSCQDIKIKNMRKIKRIRTSSSHEKKRKKNTNSSTKSKEKSSSHIHLSPDSHGKDTPVLSLTISQKIPKKMKSRKPSEHMSKYRQTSTCQEFGQVANDCNCITPFCGSCRGRHWSHYCYKREFHCINCHESNRLDSSSLSASHQATEITQESHPLGTNGFTTKKRGIALPSCQNPVFLQSTNNSTAIKMHSDQVSLTIVSSYYSPNSNILETLQDLKILVNNIGAEMALLGADLNAYSRIWDYKDENIRGSEVEDFISHNHLFLLNDKNSAPTFETNNRKYLADLSVVKAADLICLCVTVMMTPR
ncbi:hypothetical protein AVEN_28464-1 [Araneus ventricosus]|uniref:Endonuclease/exonuclease/phosphatase domain-containing protein n=1 Tax=Araneus ventricosus TaxID=182803 RepID=A0A4Y2HZE9_ARAVE|nr:hypothetical protein AVEN_28464-1 [Araneus ventricosus]